MRVVVRVLRVGASYFRYMVGLFHCLQYYLSANVNVKHKLTFTFAICYRSPACLSSVCLSSVTLVRSTQAVQICGNISTALGTLAIHGDRPRETHPQGELNTRGVAKYSDFGPIDGYITETVQDRR